MFVGQAREGPSFFVSRVVFWWPYWCGKLGYLVVEWLWKSQGEEVDDARLFKLNQRPLTLNKVFQQFYPFIKGEKNKEMLYLNSIRATLLRQWRLLFLPRKLFRPHLQVQILASQAEPTQAKANTWKVGIVFANAMNSYVTRQSEWWWFWKSFQRITTS